MSQGGDDNNPHRTVFRPSPLQGLKGGQPAPPAPPPAPPAAQQPYPAFGAQPAAPAQPAYTPPQYVPPPQQGGAAPNYATAAINDDDIPRPANEPTWRNPMVVAAAPVLALAAGMRSGRVQMALPQLHREATAAITAFDRAIAHYPPEQRQRGKYALCGTIDDIVQNLPGQGGDTAEWARRSMVVTFFQENIGGDRFWQLLDDMLAKPAGFVDLIELYHACLAAGFEGRFRVMPDGKSRLQDIQNRAYAALQHTRTLSQTELSPHWKGEPAPLAKVGFWAPLMLAGAAALVALLVIYILLRVVLIQTGQPSLTALRTINPDTPLRLSRSAAPPPIPPPSGQLQTLQTFLAPEISQHLVTVTQDAANLRVRTTVGQLFRSGSDQLEPGRQALFERIGKAVQTQPGKVTIQGFTDSDKVSSVAFPDNFALSKARANAVAAIVKAQLTDGGRVTADGLGDTQALAPNTTPAGKAQNRRVEILVPRSQ
jgi:type VI secretion system peptidoglycan-associated protein